MGILDFLGGNPRDKFARQMTARIRAKGWTGPIDYNRETFSLGVGEGGTLYLENIYREHREPGGRFPPEEMLDRFAEMAFRKDEPKTFEQVEKSLMPTVRNRAQLMNLWVEMAPPEGSASLALKPFCDCMAITVAIDTEFGIEQLSDKSMADWGRSLDQVLDTALENLRAVSPCSFERFDAGFYVSQYGDFYDASRILLPHLFDQLSLKGDPVAVVASRSGLVVAGSEDLDALAAMAEFVEEVMQDEQRPVAYLPIVFRDGQWSPLPKHPGEPIPVTRLRVRQAVWDYTVQKEVLEARHARDGVDVFVASLDVIEPAGRPVTYATWTHDAQTLLPVPDVVCINGSDGSMAARAWADVQAVCGPLSAEPDMYPPRYFLKQRPTPAQWAALQALPQPEGFPDLSAAAAR